MISDGIRKARKALGITQEELAKTLGINRATVSKYESGAISPSIETIRQIALALKIDIYDLIDSGFGALDAVLPPNFKGANLDHAKVDSKFLSVLLVNLTKLDRNSTAYIRSRNAIFALAESSNLSNMALNFITEHERQSEQSAIYFSGTQKLMEAYNRLNSSGQQEAVKRVEELTEIPRYQAQQAPQSTPAPQEGTDTTPPQDGTEGAPEGK